MQKSEIKSWLGNIVEASQFKVDAIDFKESQEWILDQRDLSHKTNRFFKVIGVEWQNPRTNQLTRSLLLDQREIGLLGFLVFNKQTLIQAKIEPGNVGIAQIAPTYQATASNSEKLHGGEKPLFSEIFIDSKLDYISDSLQSENGSKFYKKRNRNIILKSDQKYSHPENFKWINTNLLLELLGEDFLINTDARSVLVCSNWIKFLGRIPFSNKKNDFVQKLYKSYVSEEVIYDLDELIADLKKKISTLPEPQIKNLSETEGLKIVKNQISSINNDFYVKQFKVHIKGREVEKWDQPLIASDQESQINLVYGIYKDNLYFKFEYQIEPGLYNLVEIGPTIDQFEEGAIVYSVKQSEEGGRFFKNVTNYNIVNLDEITEIKEGEIWLSLKQIQELVQMEGIFTNEARSAISILLKWA